MPALSSLPRPRTQTDRGLFLATEEQKDWLAQVLGVRFVVAETPRRRAPIPLRPVARDDGGTGFASVDGRRIWDDAVDAVRSELIDLSDTLSDLDDADLDTIADLAPAELVRRLGRDIDAALVAVDAAAPGDAARVRKSARDSLSACRSLIDGDVLITLLERNPYGVPVSIRATLTGALDRLDRLVA